MEPSVENMKDRDDGAQVVVSAIRLHAKGKMNENDVLHLFETYPEDAKTQIEDGLYALHVALGCRVSERIVLAALLKHPEAAKVSDPKDKMLPLHRAIKGRYSATLVARLVEAYPQALTTAQQNGKIPLHMALANKLPDAVLMELLSQNPTAQAKTLFPHARDLPLHRALHHDYSSQVVLALLMAYPCATMIKNHAGRLPLHVAACHSTCHSTVLKELVSHYSGALAEKDNQGKMPKDLVHPGLPDDSIKFLCQGNQPNAAVPLHGIDLETYAQTMATMVEQMASLSKSMSALAKAFALQQEKTTTFASKETPQTSALSQATQTVNQVPCPDIQVQATNGDSADEWSVVDED